MRMASCYSNPTNNVLLACAVPNGSPNADWWLMLYRFVMHVWVDQATDMLQELMDEHAQRLGEEGGSLVRAVSLPDNAIDTFVSKAVSHQSLDAVLCRIWYASHVYS